MKTKTDIYTKAVLTVTAIFLGIIVFKDINFVTKAQANELDLSAMKIEDASDAEGTTFYIYENDAIVGGFGSEGYNETGKHYFIQHERSKTEENQYKKAYINQYIDKPKYIITTKTGSFWLER